MQYLKLDFYLAEKLSDMLEAEVERKIEEDNNLGKMEALRIAIEEKRQRDYQIQMRKDQEEQDRSYARSLLSYEEELIKQREDLCAKDSEYAQLLMRQMQEEDLTGSDAKAEEKSGSSPLRFLKRDQELAKIEQEREVDDLHTKGDDGDQELALREQKQLDREEGKNKREQDKEDAHAARRLLRQCSREDHRRLKLETLAAPKAAQCKDLAAVGALWENAEGEVEDVDGGICITLLLPHLRDLQVALHEHRRVVEVQARRMVIRSDKTATKDNSFYLAEFTLDGAQKMRQEDLSYEYSSAAGLLHIYIDHVSLRSKGEGKSTKDLDKDTKVDDQGMKSSKANSLSEKLRRLFV